MATRGPCHWTEYNDAQGDREVRPLLRDLLALAGPGNGRTAIDLGCGAGWDSRGLLREGWRVHAVDGEPGTRPRVLTTTAGTDQSRLTVQVTRFAELTRLPETDLLYAGYSLPYAPLPPSLA